MEATIAIVGTIVIGGLTVHLLKRLWVGIPGAPKYGFKIPDIGAGVTSFGSHTVDDARAAAEDFVKSIGETD